MRSSLKVMRVMAGVAVVAMVVAGCNPGESVSALKFTGACGIDFQLASGNAQLGQVQLQLDSVLRVRAMQTPGTAQCTTKPLLGANVTWVVTAGGGRPVQTTTVTNTFGETSVNWVMGSALGAQSVEARLIEATGNAVLARVTFTATAYSAPYRALRMVGGNNQTAAPGAVLPVRPEVVLMLVKEAGSSLPRIEQPIPAASIVFDVMSGGGTPNPAANVTATNGTSSAIWTLGSTLGQQRLRAVVNNLAVPDPRDTIQVDFVANAAAFALRLITGNTQRDTIGSRLAPLTVEYVELLDATGATRSIANTPVTWTVLTGGGTIQPSAANTDNAGRASAVWTLSRIPGKQTVRASVPPVANIPAASLQVEFEADALLVIDSVLITPSQISITGPNNTRPLVATGYFNGQPVPNLSFDWSSLNSSIASVSTSGVVTSHGVGGPIGIVAMERTSRKADTAFVTVVPAPTPRLAYALVNAASIAAGAADPAHTYNSKGGAITVHTYGGGQYEVRFPNQATPASGATTVLVSSYGNSAAWCKTEYWYNGTNGSLVAAVRCFDRATGSDGEFTIMLVGDQLLPHRFGFTYGDRPGVTTAYAPPDTASYNSANQPISIKRDSVGNYSANFPGLNRSGSAPGEAVILTALGSDPYRCGLNAETTPLTVATVKVSCVHAAANRHTPIDSRFVLGVFEKGRPGFRWGFAYNGLLDEVTTPVTLTQAQSSSTGTVRQTRLSAGRYDVVFTGLAGTANSTEGVQVTSASANGDFCKLLGWSKTQADLLVQVQCFESDSGIYRDQHFTILIIQ